MSVYCFETNITNLVASCCHFTLVQPKGNCAKNQSNLVWILFGSAWNATALMFSVSFSVLYTCSHEYYIPSTGDSFPHKLGLKAVKDKPNNHEPWLCTPWMMPWRLVYSSEDRQSCCLFVLHVQILPQNKESSRTSFFSLTTKPTSQSDFFPCPIFPSHQFFVVLLIQRLEIRCHLANCWMILENEFGSQVTLVWRSFSLCIPLQGHPGYLFGIGNTQGAPAKGAISGAVYTVRPVLVATESRTACSRIPSWASSTE